jgi:hypothetical protein
MSGATRSWKRLEGFSPGSSEAAQLCRHPDSDFKILAFRMGSKWLMPIILSTWEAEIRRITV